MADLTVTAAKVGLVFPNDAEVFTAIAGEALTAGVPIYFDTTTGKAYIADANAAGEQQARGVTLEAAAAGGAVSVCKKGHVYGYTLTSQSYDDQIFLSDTVGAFADAAGTMSVPVGRVVRLPDGDGTKCVYFEFEWNVQWS